jgi:hypothetical protein
MAMWYHPTVNQAMDYLMSKVLERENDIEFSSYITDNLHYPICRPFDHTMGLSLDEWANQKMPVNNLRRCILEQIKIEIHGIYPDFFEKYAQQANIAELEDTHFKHNPNHKRYNYIRPRFIFCKNSKGKQKLIVAVTPGRDYIFQYAGLIRHSLSLLTREYESLLTIYRYPKHENEIAIWSGLDHRFIKSNDIVILGFVDEIEQILLRNKNFHMKLISHFETNFYGSSRYQLGNKLIINFLGIKYSFWGCISEKITTRICSLGGKEIIYIGKLGSLSSPQDIYNRIFSPTKYISMNYIKIKHQVSILKNRIAGYFPEINSKLHLSVSTVAEEDHVQRKKTKQLRIQSIDNEISQMAYAVSHFNQQNNKDVFFSPLHFASDYLRDINERELLTKLDLSTNRTDEAKKMKNLMLDKIAVYLIKYFGLIIEYG